MEEEKLNSEVTSAEPVVAKKEETGVSPVMLLAIFMLVLFVVFLPDVKVYLDKFMKPEARDASHVLPPAIDDEKEKPEEEIPAIRTYVIAKAKESDVHFDLSVLLNTLKTNSPNSEKMNVTFANNVLTFTSEDKIANYQYRNPILSVEIPESADNKSFYDETFKTLVKTLASLHGQEMNDAVYTIDHPSFLNYSMDQGMMIKTENKKVKYSVANNVNFTLLDSTKQFIEIADLGVREAMIASQFSKEKGDLLVEVSIKDKVVITIGQKNQIDSLSYDSLSNIMNFIFGEEELNKFNGLLTDKQKDMTKSIYEYQYMPSDVTGKFINYNVIKLTIDRKVI